MKEDLLHFVWKMKFFATQKLQSTIGERIEIKAAGIENVNAGPDFLNAQIVIGGQLWVGNVEIHINGSDWYVHHHEEDERYQSVILHVVWEYDVAVFRQNNLEIPTLSLKKYIPKKILENYQQLFTQNKKWINCENSIGNTSNFVLSNWMERLYFERLEKKTVLVKNLLKSTHNNWEAVLFVLMAKNFGLKVNGAAFLSFANSFDFSILRKVAHNIKQLEALFFGQAGLLEAHYEGVYFKELQQEYQYLQIKFKLLPISKNQLLFFRLRPSNFPTIRLSQLAMLYHKNAQLFSELTTSKKLTNFYNLLRVATTPFWETHYTFGTSGKKSSKKLSPSFIDLLLINTIIPLKFLYEKSLGKNDPSALLKLIREIKPEKNAVVTKFNALKIATKNALETQALLTLKTDYCTPKNCLHCAIGKNILKGK